MIMAAAAFVSCEKDMPSVGPNDTMSLELDVVLPEAVSLSAGTRAGVGPYRPDSSLSSSSVCVIPDPGPNQAEYKTWYHDYLGYDNLKGSYSWGTANPYNASNYSYTPRGTTTANASRLGLFPSKGAVTIYGVYPYMADFHTMVSDLEHIPFTVGKTFANNYDYMYVDPIHIDMTGVKPGDTQTRALAFKHVMTAIEVRLSTTLTGTVIVDSVVLHAFDGNQRAKVFAMKGTFDATGSQPVRVTPDPASYVNTLPITYSSTVIHKNTPYYYTPFAFIFPPIEYKPGRKITASIYIRYMKGNVVYTDQDLDLVGLGGTMEFEFDNIQTAGLYQGLVSGYRYVYTAEIDNFIKYSGYPEIEEWVVPTDAPDDGQVKDIVI